MERKALGPSPLREASPPQADHVLVDLFFIHGGRGGGATALKPPRQEVSSISRTQIKSFKKVIIKPKALVL